MLYNGNASVLKFIPNVDRSYTVDVILLIEPRINTLPEQEPLLKFRSTNAAESSPRNCYRDFE